MSEEKETLTPQEIAELIEKKMQGITARTRTSVAQQVFQHQADALVEMTGGTPPGSGTKYEWSTDGAVANAIGTQQNVRLIGIRAQTTWTVQPTPLQIHLTVDGNNITLSQANPVSATWYHAVMAQTGNLDGTDPLSDAAFLVEGRSVKVEFEITGGTVQELRGQVKWAKIP